ncbi:wnt6 [Frankliniella occidentalis]|nr:wnt6 [Frankliniella occidentalis]
MACHYRETGFVSALMAAGVTYAVTRACSTGELVQCGCDRHVGIARPGRRRRPQPSRIVDAGPELGTGPAAPDTLNGDWVWGGCGDNVQFGARKSRAFLDAPDRRRRSGHHGLARLHNHGAGRLAVKQLMRRACKCHGLSGSCSLRTCWWRLPAFREVGDRLKDRFDAAVRVVPTNDGRSFAPESAAVSSPRRQDLVYTEESPDFCRRDLRVGSLGTQGRLCNASAAGTEGCALLCCGRGHATRVLRTATSCGCRFVWCCEVKCSSCEERRTVHSCR